MSILRESYLYHLWAVLCTVYYDSAVHRCLVRMGAGVTARSTESRVLRVLCREGVAARAWEESILCRLLTGLINCLPGCSTSCTLLRATFDDSVSPVWPLRWDMRPPSPNPGSSCYCG